ncbi:hypothetical protein E5329_27780 [Petralouisia muris]|uniref:Uncharacterized protein n=1 Tax=Petralouisia muris TaxID=3032872 RepID=A0AC61RLT4_9FIRM|nr:hypothetical protein E5329_27780 [Petralouisia muris]
MKSASLSEKAVGCPICSAVS